MTGLGVGAWAGMWAGLGLALAGCQAETMRMAENRNPQVTPVQTPVTERLPKPSGEPRCFAAFLDYRRQASATGLAYYEEVRPGLYRFTGGSPMAVAPEERLFTKDEIMLRHGLNC